MNTMSGLFNYPEAGGPSEEIGGSMFMLFVGVETKIDEHGRRIRRVSEGEPLVTLLDPSGEHEEKIGGRIADYMRQWADLAERDALPLSQRDPLYLAFMRDADHWNGLARRIEHTELAGAAREVVAHLHRIMEW